MKISLELQPCCGQKSGIGVYTYELVKRLYGHEDIVYQGNLFNFLGRNDNAGSLRDISFPIKENKLFPYGLYRRIWDKLSIQYDHLFPPADISVFFNFIVPPRLSGKVVNTIHDVTYIRYPETADSKNLKRLYKGITYSIERSTKILTVSDFSRNEISECCCVPKEKIDIVYPAASISDGICDFGDLAAKTKIRKPYILFVGSIEPRKNLCRLLQSFEMLKKKTKLYHELVLCGGKGWKNEEIYEQLGRMEYRDDVVFTGYLSNIERNTLYKNAEAFVFPSVYEGFGVPPLEAMYWRTPVVCSDVASLPEIAGEAACYVDPFSIDSIAEGLEHVLCDEEYARELVRRGETQQCKYSWEQSAKKLEQILCNL